MGADLLYDDHIHIAEGIDIKIPTIGEILEDEESYNNLLSLIIADVNDYKVFLDDLGKKYSETEDFELFTILFGTIANMDTSMVFGNLDLKKFVIAVNKESGIKTLIHKENPSIVIDVVVHFKIANALRQMHLIQKTNIKSGNDVNTEYQIQLERKRMKKRAKRGGSRFQSRIVPKIITLVNCSEFKYDYESVKQLTVYQFYQSYKQIMRRVNFDKLSMGIYFGSVDQSKLSNELKTWESI